MEINEYEKWGRDISRRKISIEGQEAGEIELVFDNKKGEVTVSRVLLKPEYQGKGHGKVVYKRLGEEFAKQGIKLCSDESRTEAAEGLWQSLVREGRAKLSENPRDPSKSVYEYIPGE